MTLIRSKADSSPPPADTSTPATAELISTTPRKAMAPTMRRSVSDASATLITA